MPVEYLIVNNETPTGAINDVNKDFDLSQGPNPLVSLKVKLNGVFQTVDVDYTLSFKTITFIESPQTGDILKVSFRYVDIVELFLEFDRIIGATKPEDNADVTGDHEADINVLNTQNAPAEANADKTADNNKWSEVVDDDANKPANNATENTGALADKDTVAAGDIDAEAVEESKIKDEAVSNEKFKFNQFKLETYFESIDALTQSATGTASIALSLASVLLSSGATINSVAKLTGEAWTEGDAVVYLKNPKFIIIAKTLVTTDQNIYMVAGSFDLDGFGFKIVDGLLYALHLKDGSEYTTQITGITLTNFNRYKAIYTSGSKIEFYVDDVLKATHTTNLPEDGVDAADELNFFSFRLKNTAGANKRLVLKYAVIQQDT